MNKVYIGIDPGVEGAIAILHPINNLRFTISFMPDGTIDAWKIISNIIIYENSIAYIEKVWKPSKLVRIAGILEGIMLSLDIPVYRVAPSTWRKEILGNKNATKDDAIKFCMENFSDINLLRTERSRVPDHNLAEAILIAEYARRKHQNEK